MLTFRGLVFLRLGVNNSYVWVFVKLTFWGYFSYVWG